MGIPNLHIRMQLGHIFINIKMSRYFVLFIARGYDGILPQSDEFQ